MISRVKCKVLILFLQIHLGQTVAEKFGSSGKTCLGGAAFPTDYLTDVAMENSTQPFKVQKRCACSFHAL
jgi:hypothetical protein